MYIRRVNTFDWSVIKVGAKDSSIPWLPERTIYLTRHGSHAYGTNLPESDLDLRGIAVPPRRYLLGYVRYFEQVQQKDPDLTIFDIHKFFMLAAECNPNALEIIFTDPSDHLIVTPAAEKLLAGRDIFISRKVKHTFSGYARSQLGRIELHYRWLKNPPQAPPKRSDFKLPERPPIPEDQLKAAFSMIQKELDSWSVDFIDHFDRGVRISIVNKMSDYLASVQIAATEQFAAAARIIGFEENMIHMIQREKEFRSKLEEWEKYLDWKNHRNPQRAVLEAKFGYDTKHGMHLVRLFLMCREMLLTGKVNVKRADAEFLLSIRRGVWSYEELIDWASKEDRNLDQAMKESPLPKEIDKAKVENLCISIVEDLL